MPSRLICIVKICVANGVEAVLEGMERLLGWERIEDAGKIIGLADNEGGGAIYGPKSDYKIKDVNGESRLWAEARSPYPKSA